MFALIVDNVCLPAKIGSFSFLAELFSLLFSESYQFHLKPDQLFVIINSKISFKLHSLFEISFKKFFKAVSVLVAF